MRPGGGHAGRCAVSAAVADTAIAAFCAGLAVAWFLKDRILERLSRKGTKAWIVLAAALVIAALFVVH